MTRLRQGTSRLAALALSAACVVVLCQFFGCTNQPNGAGAESGQKQKPVAEPLELMSGLTFTRTGGFAGFMDRLEISKDGAVLYNKSVGEPSRRTLSKEEIAALAGMLRGPGLFAKNLALTSEGADRIHYTVRYRGVTISTGGGQVPADLGPVVDWCLNQLR
jgi:hypothetical protein